MTTMQINERRGKSIGLLVSVRNAEEAKIAMQGGVDWIDVKEPLRGALGAADVSAINEVVNAVDSQVPVSVALGELLDANSEDTSSDKYSAESDAPAVGRNSIIGQKRGAIGQKLGEGIVLAKQGLAGCSSHPDWRDLWRRSVESLPRPIGPVAVIYADWQAAGAPDPQDILEFASQLGCQAALIDTFDKSVGSLFDRCTFVWLQQLIGQMRERQLLTVLGGSLNLASLENAVMLQPDYIALRGAACAGDRRGQVNLRCVRRLSQRLADLTSRAPKPLAISE